MENPGKVNQKADPPWLKCLCVLWNTPAADIKHPSPEIVVSPPDYLNPHPSSLINQYPAEPWPRTAQMYVSPWSSSGSTHFATNTNDNNNTENKLQLL